MLIAEFGTYALRLALLVAILGCVISVHAGLAQKKKLAMQEAWARVADRSVVFTFLFTTLAIGILFYAFVNNHFELAFVAQNSARRMSLFYRLTALWGGQAGSLLLWVWILLLYSAACTLWNRNQNRTLMPWVNACLLANASFFLTLVNFVQMPFALAEPILSDGSGLNPLLQHPAMVSHPLALYGGLIGFAVPFAFALAALITGELGTQWFKVTRRWTLIAWLSLSIGILLGGRWAYEVLGWGGYWAWDPVENGSFMPWLVGTAYLHSVMIQEKRDMLKTWNMVLIGLTYTTCLLGTFITRSGVVQSVHSFTNSGWFGYIFLAYMLLLAAVFFAAVYWRRAALRSPNRLESIVSREASFVINNWIFLALVVIVFFGTLFPVFSELITGTAITIGPKWFNGTTAIPAAILLFLIGVGPLIAWRKATWMSIRKQFVWPGAVGAITAIAIAVFLGKALRFYPLLFWTLSAFVIATIVQEFYRAIRARCRTNAENPVQAFFRLLQRNQQRYGGYLVHLAIVFIFIGIAGAAFDQERIENLRVGERLQMQNYELEYLTADPIPAQHYGGAIARLALYKNQKPLAIMTPERRTYWLEQQPASIPSVYSTLSEDFYVVLNAVEPDGSITLKVHRNPLVSWIWIGAYSLVGGTIAVLWPHPTKTSKPKESTQPA